MNQKNLEIDINKFLEKIKKMEKGEKLDLSQDEDLSIAIMNLISIEEHLFFTFNKTGNQKYLSLLGEIREMRKSLLKRIIKDYEGEVWCISKHLLAASMRLLEVGTKALTKGRKEEAETMFQRSYQLYSLFWGLNLGLIKVPDVKAFAEERVRFLSEDENPKIQASTGILEKLNQLVKRAIDCCRE